MVKRTPQERERRRRQNRRYRCKGHGLLLHPVEMAKGRLIVPQCQHGCEEAIEWTSTQQTAALWLDQKRDGGSTWEELEHEIRDLPVDALGRGTLETVYPLVKAWGGLPERRLPPRSRDTSNVPNPLFGPLPRQSQEKNQ